MNIDSANIISLDPKKLNDAKSLLADFLGVSKDDISLDDDIRDDLHMGASQLTDYLEVLFDNGFPTDNVDLGSVHSLQDLYEQIIDEDL